MQHSPLISVGLPIYRGIKTLRMAIRSIQLQTYENWELIVIDDGPEDGAAALIATLADPRIQYHRNPENLGLPASLNRALTFATGEFFARMDQDDISFSDRFATQLAFLQANPDVHLVGGQLFVMSMAAEPLGIRAMPTAHANITRKPHVGIAVVHPTYFGRTAWFKQHGYFEKARLCEDFELLNRSYPTSKFSNVETLVIGYREADQFHLKARRMRKRIIRIFLGRRPMKKRYWQTLKTVCFHSAMCVLDTILIITGLEQRSLLRRLGTPSQAQLTTWEQLLEECQA